MTLTLDKAMTYTTLCLVSLERLQFSDKFEDTKNKGRYIERVGILMY
jgi:hypothetical protein